MKHRFVLFGIDIWRFAPLVSVSIAVLVNIVNLRNVVEGNLSALDGLSRFAVAFLLSLVAVSGISRLLTSYGHQLAESERDETDGSGGTSPIGDTR